YVGQTKRLVKTRIAEHRNQINSCTQKNSVITEHRLQHKHDFDWEGVQILDNEPCYFRRLTSEMLFIRRQTAGLN
ncbi:hypothetical protein EAG_12774, partial [Camponotus floridanus]